MSASKFCLFGTGLLRPNRPFAALLAKSFVPQPLQFRPLCSSVAVETLSSQTTESPQQSLVHHPWPEWVTFVDNLMTKSYLIGSPPAGGGEEGDSKAGQFYKNMNLLKDPCVSFARGRYDLFKSLSLEDLQAVVECGCPNLLRKAVNSSKRLRAYLKLDEGDVCGSCNLRGSCDRAYVTLQESEATARTVDVVRILLAYALDPLVIKGDQKPPGRELAEESARKLLVKLVELSETSSAPAPPKLALEASSSKGKTSRSKERKNQSVVVERRGDWTCPKCNFLNFGKNTVCRKCKEDCPTQAVVEDVELPKGDWICSDCQFTNFSRNEVCLKCQAQGPEKREIEMKPGDWKCQDCQFVNFSRNKQCLKCQAPGPEKHSPKIEMKPGDWNCEKCSYMNFAKNVKCFRCEERRPKGRPGDWHCPNQKAGHFQKAAGHRFAAANSVHYRLHSHRGHETHDFTSSMIHRVFFLRRGTSMLRHFSGRTPEQRPPLLRPLNPTVRASFFSSTVDVPVFVSPHLEQCKSVAHAKLLHQQILVQGLTHMSLPVVRVYIDVGAPIHGRSLLERIAPCSYSVFGWNMLIRRSIQFGSYEEVLDHFQSMMRLGWRPDHYTYPFVLKACGELPSFRRGASVHGVLYVNGFEWNVFVCNAVVAMYGRCGELSDAHNAFGEILKREMADLVSWNSIVAAYVHAGDARTAVKLFAEMIDDVSISPDVISLVNVLPACATMGASLRGREVHGFAIRRGLFEDVFVGNAVLDMYAKCGRLDEARVVFDRMEFKDVVSWNAMVTGYSQVGRFEDALGLFEKMEEQKIELNVVTWSAVIAGYAQRGLGCEALDVFRRMILSGSHPNVVTLVSLLSGCASAEALLHGKETHCYAIKQVLSQHGSDLGDDLMVINAIIDMYAKCKSFMVARSMFDSVAPEFRNVVTWTAMIGGYAQHGDANDALKLFPQMFQQKDFIKPNAFTLSCALLACSRLGALRSGKEIHAYVLRNQYGVLPTHINNCLIDMYSKSAHIDAARAVFNYMHAKNDVSWTSLMTGYGMHGRGEEAIRIFNEMRRQGLVLDGVPFVVLLYACSHSGMVDQGIDYFNAMKKDFGVEPGVEHYACMVDLLGRGGRLGEAMKLIKNMPMKPTPIVWFSLLSACRLHGNVEFGEYAANKLMELESGNDGSYTLLSNIYANAKQWKDVARVRSLMRSTGIRKRPGASWVQGNKGTATFFVGDRTHPQSQKIYDLLADLMHRIKAMGYVPQTSYALHDVDDEEKGDLLFEHSEKIALAYAILTSTPGATIRITKNLRVCGDCHSAITYISMLVDHEIILRDSSRFHHFKKGTCSCGGYW